MPQTTIVGEKDKLLDLLNNPGVEVGDIVSLDSMLVVNWRHVAEDLPTADFSSVVVAAHVTAQARLHLYSALEFLGDRVLYGDTDSVFFKEKPGDPVIEKGDYLGQLTDELDSWPGSYISEFVCGKNSFLVLNSLYL